MYSESECRQAMEKCARTLGYELKPGEILSLKPKTILSPYCQGDTITCHEPQIRIKEGKLVKRNLVIGGEALWVDVNT